MVSKAQLQGCLLATGASTVLPACLGLIPRRNGLLDDFLLCISSQRSIRWGKNARGAACLFLLHLAAKLVSDKLFAKSWKCAMDKTYPNLCKFGETTSELKG